MPSEGPTSEVLDFRKMPAFSMSGENRASPGDSGELDEPASSQFTRLVVVTHEYLR